MTLLTDNIISTVGVEQLANNVTTDNMADNIMSTVAIEQPANNVATDNTATFGTLNFIVY